MLDAPHIAGVAHLIGDATRAAMLTTLKHDHCLSATELARVAGVAPSTGSGHLAMLVQSGLVAFDACGRHRYYRLAGPEVAHALEAMESLAAAVLPADRLGPPRESSARFARVCYDHLAGTLGVALTQSLVAGGHLKQARDGFTVSAKGRRFFGELGIDVKRVTGEPRVLARQCPDWSEGRPHLGGAMGVALLDRLTDLEWLRVGQGDRVVRLTVPGRRAIREWFNVDGLVRK